MGWFNWKRSIAAVALLAGGAAYAAGRSERMASPDYIEGLLTDLTAAAGRLEPHSPVLSLIESGDLDAAREMLGFRPYAEAPTPKGFPGFTPVGLIEVKRYPAYRKAVGPGFWPLFNHIKTQSIPMTAPVEMARTPERGGRSEMAFLYQNTSVGQAGPIDGVAVVDVPATLVASLGMRGRMTEERVDDARAALNAWLAAQSKYLVASEDSFRLFGYSSPMTPDGDKYWEAQLLLRLESPSDD